jgi:hypothetical protein
MQRVTDMKPITTAELSLFDQVVFNNFIKHGEVVEIRVPHFKGRINGENVRGTTTGYFDDHNAFSRAVQALEGQSHTGIYFTLQVIDPRLLARAFNRMKPGIPATSDNSVLAYRWLYLDIDPVRPTGISSSNSELKKAHEVRERVIACLDSEYGFKNPLTAMSGNGYHALYRLPDLPVNEENKTFIKDVLNDLAKKYNTDAVTIDTAVFNPARICKLYGTTARKGDEVPGNEHREERPYRMTYIESLGGNGND